MIVEPECERVVKNGPWKAIVGLREPYVLSIAFFLILCLLATSSCSSPVSQSERDHDVESATVIAVPGFSRKARITLDTSQRLLKLIDTSGLRPFINGGQFVVNRAADYGLSILVLSPTLPEHLNVGAMNAAYDRTGDVIVIGEQIVPSAQTLEKLSRRTPLSTAERSAVRFCQFVLLHELGHREVGDIKTTRFYFEDSWLSKVQFEELKADEWAMDSLFKVVHSSNPVEKSELVRDVAQSALREYFGRHHDLAAVPSDHPSMFYRIASLYQACQSLIEHEDPQVLPEAAAVWETASKIESNLVNIVGLPDGQTLQDSSSVVDRLFVLTKNGVLYAVDAGRVSFPAVLPSSRTVQRYGRISLSADDQLMHFSLRGSIVRVAAVGNLPYVVNIAPMETTILNSLGEVIAAAANPLNVRLENDVPVVVGEAEEIKIVFRDRKRLVLLSINIKTMESSTAEFDLNDVAPQEQVDAVGVRGQGVLVCVADGIVREVWALRPAEKPEFLVACTAGGVIEPTMGLLGLMLLGYGPGELIDVRRGNEVGLRADESYLGQISGVHRMIRSLTELETPLAKLSSEIDNPLTWDLSTRSQDWSSTVLIDRNDQFDVYRFVTGRRGSAEFYLFAPFKLSAQLDLETASRTEIMERFRKLAIERHGEWMVKRQSGSTVTSPNGQ